MEKGRLQIKKKKKTIISTIKITYTIEGKRPDTQGSIYALLEIS